MSDLAEVITIIIIIVIIICIYSILRTRSALTDGSLIKLMNLLRETLEI